MHKDSNCDILNKIEVKTEILEQIYENQLLEKANSRTKSEFIDFSKAVADAGFDMKEIEELYEIVEIE